MGPRQSPGGGLRGAKPFEAKRVSAFLMALESSLLSYFLYIFSSLEYREMPLVHLYACNMMYQYAWIHLALGQMFERSTFL